MAEEDYVNVRTKQFANGDVCTGTWSQSGMPDGEGKYTWRDGSIYEGSWKEGAKHGVGKYTWPSGATYHGEWRDGSMHGVGTWESADGLSRYQGGWHLGDKHGLGRQVYASGDVYEGLWKLGYPGGPGRYVYADGNEYDGEWRAGRMHGQGTFVWRGGERYDGEWKDGRMDGAGLFTAADASTYDGRWRRGRKHGVGIFRPGATAAVADGGGGPTVPSLPSKGGAADGPGTLAAAVGFRLSGGGWSSHSGGGSGGRAGRVSGGGGPAAAATPLVNGAPLAGAGGGGGGGGALLALGKRPCPSPSHTPPPPPPIMFPSPAPSTTDSPRTHTGQGQGPSPQGPHVALLAAADRFGAQQQQTAVLAAPTPSHHQLHYPHPPDTSNPASSPAQSAAVAPPTLPGPTGEGAAALGPCRVLRVTSGSGRGSAAHGSSGPPTASAAGGKQVSVRVYDKGRPLRETVLSADDVESLMPGMAAAGRGRGSRDDRGPNQLLRLLRGGAIAAVAGGPRPRGPRLGDTVTRAHHSYALMVALQLGIRYSVGRISHEPLPRGTSQDEYGLRVQQEFPRGGSEMTPVHPVEDFTWSDYAPMTFRRLRESFGVDASTYLLSLCADHSLRHLASPGKSGSVFFLSQDERFFIKTMSRCEMEVLLSMLAAYHRHVERHPHTLLCRFFGVHCVMSPGGRKYRFVVMSNIFRTPLQLHRKYDLKGSTLGRTAGRPSADDPTVIFKDLDLDLQLRLEDGWRDRLLFQLRADCGLLAGVGVMDYSLLVGLHFRRRGGPGGDNTRDLEAYSGPAPVAAAADTSNHPNHREHPNYREHSDARELASEYARMEERIQRLRLGAAATGDLLELARMRMLAPRGRGRDCAVAVALSAREAASKEGLGGSRGPAGGAANHTAAAACADPAVSVSVNDQLALSMGQSHVQLGVNMAATAVHKDGREEDAVLWFALIDILQPYNATKRLEHGLKSVIHAASSISVTHPNAYATRFQAFIKRVFE
uniref:1-phosphatidylinositol-4-phosphate 5-kinase n=1 Tax=Yamagishiella unicocca TaxID=51707 RepID=A0A2Z5X8B3_9CHLO|nr:1-phosphatidylinositol-4-phosphate 5-kinase [Yamagishiella unicocca]